MGLPINYRKTSSGIVASYDSFDLVTGVGYKKYYACGSNLTGGQLYFITPEVIDSDNYYVSGTITEADFTKQQDIDFDLQVNNAVIVSGEVLSNVTYCITSGSGEHYIIMYVYKVVGVTETQIATAQTATRTTAGGPAWYRDVIKATLTKTGLVAGEKLRVNIQFWGKTGSSGAYRIFFDPTNARTTGITGIGTTRIDLPILIPYRIDL